MLFSHDPGLRGEEMFTFYLKVQGKMHVETIRSFTLVGAIQELDRTWFGPKYDVLRVTDRDGNIIDRNSVAFEQENSRVR